MSSYCYKVKVSFDPAESREPKKSSIVYATLVSNNSKPTERINVNRTGSCHSVRRDLNSRMAAFKLATTTTLNTGLSKTALFASG